MSEWVSCEEMKPPERSILVWGKCGTPHITIWDYECHCHTEACFDSGGHFPGAHIEFSHWQDLPKEPNKVTKMSLEDREFIQLLYSEDRELCTYLKGCRFECIRLLEDQDLNWWVHGVGYLGCHTWIQLDQKQRAGMKFIVDEVVPK